MTAHEYVNIVSVDLTLTPERLVYGLLHQHCIESSGVEPLPCIIYN